MSAPGGRRWCRVIGRGLVVGLAVSTALQALSAQTVSEPALKAAFLIRFAKFTDWPTEILPDQAPLVFCVFDGPVADALSAATSGQSVGSHPLSVTRLAADAPVRSCALLYVTGIDGPHLAALESALQGTSVLSVGDDDEFTKRGGIIHFFVEDGHMRFAVNVTAAERAHLHISAQMLSLAKIVRD